MKNYNIKLLDELDDLLKQEVNECAKMVHLRKGDLPFFHDDLLKNFYFVVEGKIKAYHINLETSKEQTIFIYRRGDMLDTIILLDSDPHEVFYEVLEESEVLQVPIEKVREWICKNPSFSKKIFPYIATQMRNSEELSSDLSLHDTSHRLMKLIVQNFDSANKVKYNLLENLSNSEIAKLIGSVRHVVERHLNELKEQNIIKRGRKNISLENMEKLLQKTKQMLLK